MVGWYPLLRVLSVITAFMNGNTPNRRRIRGRHSWIGEGITEEVQVGARSREGSVSTRDSPSSKLFFFERGFVRSWKLLSYFSHLHRLIGRYNASKCLTSFGYLLVRWELTLSRETNILIPFWSNKSDRERALVSILWQK